MQDGLQGVSLDRWLIRAKDVALLLGFAGSVLTGLYIGVRFVERMNDRVQHLENRVTLLERNKK